MMLAVIAAVALQAPPHAPAGPAYFLAGTTVFTVDDAGVRHIADDVWTLHLADDGTVWGCNPREAVRWDGTRATRRRLPPATEVCAAGPDGALWVVTGRGRVFRFDGRWQLMGEGETMMQIVVARDGVVYGYRLRSVFVLEDRRWRLVNWPEYGLAHLFVGGDGRAWLLQQMQTREGTFPAAVTPVEPTRLGEPIVVAPVFHGARIWVSVDAAGVVTRYDAVRNAVAQGTQEVRLPAPNTTERHQREPNAFAYDAAGRIWVDLVDGLAVIDRDGTRHVIPRAKPVTQIVVVGAGPPSAAVERSGR